MALRVSGKNMDVGEALREKAQDYFETVVGKYFDGGYEGHMTLSPEGFGFRADCAIHLDSGALLKASASAPDAVAAYTEMADHIAKRLRRYKRKLKGQRRTGDAAEGSVPVQAYVLQAPEGHEEVAEDFSPPIIAESTANLRQLSVGEAVMELDLAQHDVLVFRHAGHGGVNVVYRRADGNIGWIDPALGAN